MQQRPRGRRGLQHLTVGAVVGKAVAALGRAHDRPTLLDDDRPHVLEDEQGQADDGDQGGDAPVVLQEDRRDGEGALDVAVAALDGGLILIAAEDLGSGDVVAEVGQQGVPAVTGGFGVAEDG